MTAVEAITKVQSIYPTARVIRADGRCYIQDGYRKISSFCYREETAWANAAKIIDRAVLARLAK